MPDDISLGRRVQSVRKRRGLTQAELASAAGLSVSLVSKLEQDLITDIRMETAHKIAAALRVPTTSLLAGPDAAPPDDGDVDQWEPVRRALEGRPGPEPAGEPTLDGLAAAFRDAVPLLTGNRFAEIGALLPALLRDADALVAGSAGAGRTAARELRSQIRQAASHLMSQTWQFDAADHAVALAIDDASDPLTTMTAMDEKCWALMRAGRIGDSRDLATRWADRAEPRISRATREELAGWGTFLLRASSAAIRDNRPGEAADALRLARAAATITGPDIALPFNRMFGPATVTIIQAENAMIADRPDLTLAIAAQLDGKPLPLPRYHHRHRLDVASAHVAKRQHAEATAVLLDIRQHAPQWLAHQRYARDIVTRMLNRRRTLTPHMQELAAAVRLPI